MTDTERAAEEWARAFHQIYNLKALECGWPVNGSCLTSFDELPPANRKTMTETCREMRNLFCPRWISVKERMPEHMQVVLVWSARGVEMAQWWTGGPGPATWLPFTLKTDYWMPLPSAPEEQGLVFRQVKGA